MQTVLILKGLPASGKSTYAKSLSISPAWKRVNKDDLRAMLDDSVWSKQNEKFIIQVRNDLIGMILAEGKSVVVDDTNLHPKHEQEIRDLVAHMPNVKVETKFFEVDVEVAIKRDLQRPVSVGEKVIRRMYRDFLAPAPPVIARNPNLPDCVLVDLDGTMALIHDRNPYDASKCEQDIPNTPVVNHVKDLLYLTKHTFSNHTKVIFMSGRSSEFRRETLAWLFEQGFNVSEDESSIYTQNLFMRAEKDTRQDSIVKEELYRKYIEGKYNVKYALDDRNQVVDMWRSLGLTVFQVALGDF